MFYACWLLWGKTKSDKLRVYSRKKIRNNKIKRSCKIEICRAHIFKAEALSSIIYGCSELYDATTLKWLPGIFGTGSIWISFLFSHNYPFLLFFLVNENKVYQCPVNVVLVNWSSKLSNAMQKSSVGQYMKVLYPAFQSAV